MPGHHTQNIVYFVSCIISYIRLRFVALNLLAVSLERSFHPLHTFQGMTFLAAALPSSIVELDLSNNPAVGEKGGKAIARFLLDFVRSANLRRLDVSMCNLRDEGLASLAEGVEAAKGLEWLSIARNLNDPGSVVGAGAGSGAGKTALGESSSSV